MNRNLSKLLLAGAALAFVAPALAGSFTVLHTFKGGKDGAMPIAAMTSDGQGNFYGTTRNGGSSRCDGHGCGTVFRLGPDGGFTIVHAFRGDSDGANPYAPLTLGTDGAFYGTTQNGGASSNGGTVFRLTSDGQKKRLYSFLCAPDACVPEGRVALDASGNIYGTSVIGGQFDAGAIFKVSPDGTEKVLHSFKGGDDGSFPTVGLILGSDGNLYGATLNGGAGCSSCGTVFEIAPTGEETILYAFLPTGGDGRGPAGDLAMDGAGNLYGTTVLGGANNLGAIFKITTARVETILHSFGGPANNDGAYPEAGVLLDGPNLYGTTTDSPLAGGTVYRLKSDGTESILHLFNGQKKGAYPQAALITDGLGNLYGTAPNGGATNRHCGSDGCGTVFRLPQK
jgi:uncharacterized repeat protein (TIGR03803 family)